MRVTLDTNGDTITVSRQMDGANLGQRCITEKDALSRLLRKVPASGILPPSLRWVSPSGAQAIFERAPCRVKIRYSPVCASQAYGYDDPHEYHLPLPWTVYGVSQTNQGTAAAVYLYAVKRPLQGMDDALYHLPLTNLYTEGKFCIPSHNDRAGNLAELVDLTLRLVWSSGFNLDMASALEVCRNRNRPAYLMRHMRPDHEHEDISVMLQKWSEMSLVDAGKLDWCPSSTVEQLIRRLHSHSEGSRSPGALMTVVSSLAGAGGSI